MDEMKRATTASGADKGGITLAWLRARRDEILRIAAAHGADNVRVFGSVARGDADSQSDIDFLVDLPSSCKGFEYFGVLDGMRATLETALGHKVDVLSIRGVAPQARPMADRILREAIPL